MSERIDGELLAKYFAGECSPGEKNRVHEWISERPGAAERMARLQHIWEATKRPSSSWNAQDAWRNVRERMEEGDAESSTADEPSRDRPSRDRWYKRRARSTRRRLVSAAALVFAFVLGLLGSILTGSGTLAPTESEAKVYTAEKGERTTLHLSDGSRVRLNVDSRLTIPAEFEERREARLEGEAYFDVVEDPAHPFIVRTEQASIQVLGTAFNVRSYTDSKEMRVAVTEGKVALRTSHSEDQDTSAVLPSRSLASTSNHRLEYVQENVELSKEIAWTGGKLIFEEAPFDEVASKLERWYDIEVEARVLAQNVIRLNAAFEDTPLNEVLHDIAAALDLKYERDGRRVTFHR